MLKDLTKYMFLIRQCSTNSAKIGAEVLANANNNNSSFIDLSAEVQNGSSNALLPLCHVYRFVFSFNILVGLNRLHVAALLACPMVFYSFCCIEKIVNILEVVDCTFKLTFHKLSDLYLVTELTFLSVRRVTVSVNSNIIIMIIIYIL